MKLDAIASHPENERISPDSDIERTLMAWAINGAISHQLRILVGEQPQSHYRLSANLVLCVTAEWNEAGELKVVGHGDLEFSETGYRADRKWRLSKPAVLWYSLARKLDGKLVVMRRVESTGEPSGIPE